MKKTFAFILSILILFPVLSQTDLIGKWKTVDDETGEIKSVVEIYERGGKYFGKIVKLLLKPSDDPDPVCTACEGENFGKKILGMEIITNLSYKESTDELVKGKILDPETGSVYDCKIWLEDGNLKLRGYLLFFYRTQTWLRYKD
ncbi:MAG: DUF2147 domain-containing protein [Bacteroidota bacterium]